MILQDPLYLKYILWSEPRNEVTWNDLDHEQVKLLSTDQETKPHRDISVGQGHSAGLVWSLPLLIRRSEMLSKNLALLIH